VNVFRSNTKLSNQILTSLSPILDAPEHVIIDHSKIQALAEHIESQNIVLSEDFTVSLIQKYIPVKRDAVDLLCVFNSINFCFWAQNPTTKWRYYSSVTNREEDGAHALFLALIKNYLNNNTFFKGSNLAKLDHNTLTQALVNRTPIPLIKKRLHILQNVGQTLEREYDNHFSAVFTSCAGHNASQIMNRMLTHFPSFNDSVQLNTHRAYFLKRAQLLLTMIQSNFSHFFNPTVIDELTVFADYKIPMMLEHYGVLHYSTQLQNKIRQRELIPRNSPMELEIRASTILAVEQLREHSRYNAAQLDNILWNMSQNKEIYHKNYHLTLTTAY
jgi:hypothetical protein